MTHSSAGPTARIHPWTAPRDAHGTPARPAAALALAASLAAAGCGLLDPRPDTSRYYTLPTGAAASVPPPAGGARSPAPSLGLGPVTLPSYLDRPQLVTRLGPERLALSSGDRWAAPLDEQFWRALAEDLRVEVPARELLAHPWPRAAAPDLAVTVDVLRFEPGADGAAVLEARWAVGPGTGGPPLATGETRVREPAAPGDADAAVAALGRAVEALARDVGAAVRRLPRR
jgi:uncharacterized lipoprotein YmbA